MRSSCQVVVVGAGPAGCATAAALAQQKIDVLLLDKASFPREKICGDGLTPRSVKILQRMDVLSQLQAAGAMRILGARFYAPNGKPVDVRFDEMNGPLPPFGLTLPRKELDRVLLQHAIAAGAHFVPGFRVKQLLKENNTFNGVRGQHNGEVAQVAAQLVCLATGAALPLVQQSGLLPAVPQIIRASRSYFENTHNLDPYFQMYFDKNLMPGYGWIFPLKGGKANVGAGYFPDGQFRNQIIPPRQLYDRFVGHNPIVRRLLASARPAAPVKSYPLRTDFLTIKTQTHGLMLVGEAAGLVNPINGEGVDYALESGTTAAEVAAAALADADLSAKRLSEYGQRLQRQYHSFFFYLIKMRNWYVRERVFNLLVRKADRRPQLKHLLVNASLGLVDPKQAVSIRTLKDVLL